MKYKITISQIRETTEDIRVDEIYHQIVEELAITDVITVVNKPKDSIVKITYESNI